MAHPPLLLELDLTEELLAAPPTDPLGMLQARRRSTVRSVLTRLYEAAADPRVGGLVAKLGVTGMSLARAQELAAAVTAVRDAGKVTVAWAETFGELGGASVPYVLAAAFGEVWLQPSGGVGITGVSAQAVFLRDALDKAGVDVQAFQRHEYKSAGNMLTERGFTPAHREATERLAESVYEQVVTAIATARRQDQATVRAAVDRAPLSAQAALDAGLVDRLGYRDQVYADVRRRLGGDVRLLFLARYQPPRRPADALRRAVRRDNAHVALVTGAGPIRLGESGRAMPRGPAMGSDTVCAALRAALRDDDARAVVLRVDSPGGSYVASDAIWRDVVRLREAGKPVVVSMGDVAASGGYFVACPADVIVASPATITGSIGVIAAKPVVNRLAERLGVAVDSVDRGAHAGLRSPFQAFDEEARAHLDRWLDEMYEDFLAKVAQGRGMTREQVHEVARGRVWTGADAHERGLVDLLGGLRLAESVARERAGLAADAPVRPARQPSLVRRVRRPRNSEDVGATSRLLPGSLASALAMAQDGPLRMPPLSLS